MARQSFAFGIFPQKVIPPAVTVRDPSPRAEGFAAIANYVPYA
jgi:hypothetical protein